MDTCWLALSEWIIPAVLASSFDLPHDAHALLEPRIRGHRMARAAVEMGIWAISASQNNSSLAAFLTHESANAREAGTAPRTFVETGVALGIQSSPDELAARALAARAEGYRRIKIKITPGRDTAYARAVRDAIGGTIALTVNANGSYSLQNRNHVKALEELDTLGLSMIEQPLAHDELSPSARYWQRDIVTEPWTMDAQDRVAVPLDKVGIGVDVDTAFVEELTVRRKTFSA